MASNNDEKKSEHDIIKIENGKSKALKKIKSILKLPEIPIFFSYAIVTILMTYPAITLKSKIYAEPKDPLGVIWLLWWYKYAYQNGLSPTKIGIIGYPFGRTISPYSADIIHTNLSRFLSILFNETIAYNILTLSFFFLTALSTYFLVRHITKSRPASAFSGFAFAFSPFMLMQGKEHLGLISLFWMSLLLLLILITIEKPGWLRIFSCGVIFLLMSLFVYQLAILGGFLVISFVLFYWLSGMPWRKRKAFRRQKSSIRTIAIALMVAAPVIIILLFAFLALKKTSVGLPKEMSQLYLFSARPWEFFLPTAEGALFGPITKGIILNNLHGSNLAECSLFLGYIPIALSIYALFKITKRKEETRGTLLKELDSKESKDLTKSEEHTPTEEEEASIQQKRVAIALAATLIASFIFSMPPTAKIAGLKLYFPSFFLHKFIPQFRVYERFGAVTMLCISILSGIGLSIFLKNKSAKRGILITMVLCIFVLAEFTVTPPVHSISTNKPPAYANWLKDKKASDVVAIYPLFFPDDFSTYRYLFEQRYHKKPMVNGNAYVSNGRIDLSELVRDTIIDLCHPMTPAILKGLGVKYVVVEPEGFEEIGHIINFPIPFKLNEGKLPKTLKEIKRFPDSIIYEITAEPSKFVPFFAFNTDHPFFDPDGFLWHPCLNDSTVTIQSFDAKKLTVRVSFEACSVRENGNFYVYLNGKKVLTSAISKKPSYFQIDDVELKPGENSLVLRSTTKAAYLSGIPGYEDEEASLLLSNIMVEEK